MDIGPLVRPRTTVRLLGLSKRRNGRATQASPAAKRGRWFGERSCLERFEKLIRRRQRGENTMSPCPWLLRVGCTFTQRDLESATHHPPWELNGRAFSFTPSEFQGLNGSAAASHSPSAVGRKRRASRGTGTVSSPLSMAAKDLSAAPGYSGATLAVCSDQKLLSTNLRLRGCGSRAGSPTHAIRLSISFCGIFSGLSSTIQLTTSSYSGVVSEPS